MRTWMILVCMGMMAGSCSSPATNDETGTGTKDEAPKVPMHLVEITQMKFNPAELKVKKGDKVVFVNHDLVTHDITEESKREWSSSPLAPDQNWVLVATGNVNYFCSIHPVMKGRIMVEE